MIPEALALSFVVALLRGGRIANLASFSLRKVWLIIVPCCCLIGLYVAKSFGSELAGGIAHYFQLLVYACIIAALCFNLRVPGVPLVALGTALNLLVALVNGGDMPVSMAAVKAAGLTETAKLLESDQLVRHVQMSPHTRLNFLADVIPALWVPAPLRCVMSVGDVIVSVGLFVVVQHAMVRRAAKPAAE